MRPWPKYDINIAWIVQGVYTPHNQISDDLGHNKACDLRLTWKQTNVYVCMLSFQTAAARCLHKAAVVVWHNVRSMTTTDMCQGHLSKYKWGTRHISMHVLGWKPG
jgi:hypothetical protein